MRIGDQCMVTIHYRLTDGDGTIIDASQGKKPLEYLHGAHNIIPGLEKELTGKTAGDHLEVEIQPQDGYGIFDPQLVKTLPLQTFQGVGPLEPGMCFETRRQDGQTKLLTIREVSDHSVVVDENHPLAGQILFFDVSVVEVRVATREELTHVTAPVQ